MPERAGHDVNEQAVMVSVAVSDLIAGDVVFLDGPPPPGSPTYATYVTQLPHPKYAGLRQVVWRLEDGSWSYDALDPRQAVGKRNSVMDMADRVERLREVLGG